MINFMSWGHLLPTPHTRRQGPETRGFTCLRTLGALLGEEQRSASVQYFNVHLPDGSRISTSYGKKSGRPTTQTCEMLQKANQVDILEKQML
ncbi:hypothetical protein Vadar_013855 [Vaccinium darrowii]|uniref:Uncharacterized protein n=1 Tax=Vaccinium darrowii TaxID=229202 RepID=A0ACB7XII6_9ERIC|nr:hypothetical protein Vadar_013855 [Vaccinium darrowii]